MLGIYTLHDRHPIQSIAEYLPEYMNREPPRCEGEPRILLILAFAKELNILKALQKSKVL